MATKAFLEKAYLAYFGRPVDPTGLTDYAASTETQVADAFAASAESKALYGTTFDYAQINAIYLALFNRTAERAGLEYWYAKVDDKTYTPAGAAIAILNGALNADKIAIENKLAASAAFSAALDTASEMIGYSGAAAAASARSFLSTITATAATAAAVDAAVVAVVAAKNAVADQTFTLTTSFDTITGSAGNDVFNASGNGLLTTSDTVTGGAGTDTINSRHTVTDAVTINAAISGVEVHNVRIDHDGAAADVFTYSMTDVSGATKVVMDRSVNSGSTADAVFTISGSGFTTAVITGISGGDTGADNSAIDLTATYASTTGGSDSATLEVNGGQANVVTIAAIETLNISALKTDTSASSTGASKINSLQASSAKVVNISGDGAVRLSGANATHVAANFDATVTVDATANSGGVNFLSETNTLTFKGGSGNDAVFMAGTLTSADVLTGGAGTDTIGITTDTTLVNGAGVSGFEILDLAGATTPTIDLDNFANNTTWTGLAVSVETGTVAALNNLPTGSTFTIGGTAAITAGSDITIGIKGAALAGRNSDSLAIVVTGTGAVDYGTLVVANTESLSIASGGVLTGNSMAVLTAAAATTLTLTGASAFEITAFTDSAVLNNINASAMTGDFVMGAVGANTGATAITGGAGNDTLRGNNGNDIIIGGAGIDTIVAGLGADDVTGGAGADIITIGARTANSVAASATSLTATIAQGDSMTFGNGVDIIRGFVSGSDTLAVSAAITASIEGVVPTTLIGALAGDLAEDKAHGARGDFVESTGKFTFSATGADFLLTINDGTAADDVLSTSTNAIVLIGVTALVAADLT